MTSQHFVTSSRCRKKAAAAAAVIGSHLVDRSNGAAAATVVVVAASIAVATCQRTMYFRLIVTLAHVSPTQKFYDN